MAFTLFLVFCTVALVGYAIVPVAYSKTVTFGQRRAHQLSSRLDRVVPRQQVQQITKLYFIAPLALAVLAYLFLIDEIKMFGVALGIVLGLVFPGIYTRFLIAKNRRKFDDQLIDALMIMSSSFRGGLSLIQAMEAVVDEMPDPIAQEVSTVLGENKMGVPLEEALNHFYKRMPSPALQQVITAILLARETGGNLPAIFQRIVGVIRERKRIQGQIDTLTIQGKIQGVVMSLLPVLFFSIVYSTNPKFYDHMFHSQMGRSALMAACVLQVVGAYLIWKISSFKDF